MEWLKEIKIEELPQKYREMAEVIGLEATIKLAEYFGKEGFYFTSLDGVISAKFQSTLPRGERQRRRRPTRSETVFQSTLPRGERR